MGRLCAEDRVFVAGQDVVRKCGSTNSIQVLV